MKNLQQNKILQFDHDTILKNNTDFYPFLKILDLAEKIKIALKDENLDKIYEFLQDQKATKSFVIARGENNNFLNLISESFQIIMKKNEIASWDDNFEQFIKLLHDKKIPEMVLYDLISVYYHKRESKSFLSLTETVLKNKNLLKHQTVYFGILHAYASWQEAVEKKFGLSIEKNTEVILGIDKKIDKHLYLKAKFGITYNKELLPKQKIIDFLMLADDLMEINNFPDAFRAIIEAGRAYLDLARQQGIKQEVFSTLDNAKDISLKALKIAKDIKYPNLEIIATEIMSDIYKIRIEKYQTYIKNHGKDEFIKDIANKFKDDKRKMNSFLKKELELRKKYNYQTKFKEKYKKTFYSHIN